MSGLSDCVLVVEDEYLIAEGLRLQLQDIGHTVCGVAATARDAVAMAEAHRPSLVLMDVRLRGSGDGVDAALAIHARVGSKVIFVTGSREPATLERIKLDHPAAVLFKPLFGRQLQNAVEQVLAG
ncbi:MAG TPA: response regulator [Caulobacteraceae bacterium]|jgi:CheY-like chemotaxis protein|nr:response regulator [Caulobacteraceae bacterium]